MHSELDQTESVQPKIDYLSVILIQLLKGIVYREQDKKLWSELINLQRQVREFVKTLGLELSLDESEGYAFLRSQSAFVEGPEPDDQPRLVVRRQLSFPLSLLIALLRKRLVEFDARGGDTRLILTQDDIIDSVRVFLPEGSNEAKIVDQVEKNIDKVVDLGFLKELKTSTVSAEKSFEVRRIIKAFVDAQWLATFDEKLSQYKEKLSVSLGVDKND